MTARTISEMQREMDEQCELGNIGAVMDLVDEMGNLEDRTLKAIAIGDLQAIQHLEALGVDVHGANGFFYRKAIRSAHLDVVRYSLITVPIPIRTMAHRCFKRRARGMPMCSCSYYSMGQIPQRIPPAS